VIKSLVSLEPSISLIQMGESLYLAKHYIGVDQPLSDSVDSLDRFVEAIKTLRGTEPNLQTVYLLTSELVEEQLKEKLSGILPLQQLAENSAEDAKMPGYLEKTIVASMRTISVTDFEIPQFDLTTVPAEHLTDSDLETATPVSTETELEAEVADLEEEIDDDLITEGESLPKPGSLPGTTAVPIVVPPIEDTEVESAVEQDDLDSSESFTQDHETVQEPLAEDEQSVQIEKQEVTDEVDLGEIDLHQFANVSAIFNHDEKKHSDKEQSHEKKGAEPRVKVVKNDDGTGNLVKLLLVGLGTFALTVIIGVGIGLGALQFSQSKSEGIESPIVEPTGSPTGDDSAAEPTPTPESIQEVDRGEYSIRVVNATTKAGYASQIAGVIDDAGYASTQAKNAVDEYEPGFYLLMIEEDEALLTTLSQDLDLELEYASGVEVEDPNSEFDAVVVLAN
jgi:hypothetical protein